MSRYVWCLCSLWNFIPGTKHKSLNWNFYHQMPVHFLQGMAFWSIMFAFLCSPGVVQLICDATKLLLVNVDLGTKMLVDRFHLHHLEKEGMTWIKRGFKPVPATCSSPRSGLLAWGKFLRRWEPSLSRASYSPCSTRLQIQSNFDRNWMEIQLKSNGNTNQIEWKYNSNWTEIHFKLNGNTI